MIILQSQRRPKRDYNAISELTRSSIPISNKELFAKIEHLWVKSIQFITSTDEKTISHDSEEDLKWIEEEWIKNYYSFSEECGGVSLTENLFQLRCCVKCCTVDRSQPTPSITQESLRDLIIELNCLICRHTPERKENQTTDEMFELLDTKLSLFITKNWSSVSNHNNTMDKFDHLDEKLYKKRDKVILDNEITLAVINSMENEQLKQTALSLWNYKENSTAPNDVGSLWDMNPMNMYVRFIPIANRFMAQWLVEKRWWNYFPGEQGPMIDIIACNRFKKWVEDSVTIETPDSFLTKYHELLGELMLPLGARLMRQRYSISRFETNTRSETLLFNELGFDTASSLNELMKVKTSIVASTEPRHPNYDGLVIKLFDHWIQHEDKCEFLKNHIVLNSNIVNHPSKIIELTKKDKNHPYNYPIILIFTRGVAVWYNQTRYDFKVIEEAILYFLILMERDHNSVYKINGPGHNLKTTYDRFFSEPMGD